MAIIANNTVLYTGMLLTEWILNVLTTKKKGKLWDEMEVLASVNHFAINILYTYKINMWYTLNVHNAIC